MLRSVEHPCITHDTHIAHFAIGPCELVLASRPLPPSPRAELTPVEREIVDAMLAGLGGAEIARRRGRAQATVRHQIESIYRKLGVRSKAELIALCAASPASGAPDDERG